MTRIKLKACPHCGGKAKLWQSYTGSWCVQCGSCGATTLKGEKKDAAERWNRRVTVLDPDEVKE